jgi:hypothetical protein
LLYVTTKVYLPTNKKSLHLERKYSIENLENYNLRISTFRKKIFH